MELEGITRGISDSQSFGRHPRAESSSMAHPARCLPCSCTSSHCGSTASRGRGAPRHLSQRPDVVQGPAGQRRRVAGDGNQEAADVIFGCNQLDRSSSNKS